MNLTPRDEDRRLDSPPLQGRGRGWGLSAGRIAELHGYAAAMRREPTGPEARLWARLRASQLGGFKFRRQATIGQSIVDFLCPAARLIVEVDGETHDDPARDARRDAALSMLGYRVVRMTNDDIMDNIEGVLQHLLTILCAAPVATPHPNPYPEGEGLSEEYDAQD